MAKKKDTPVRLDQLTEEEKMKYEIADELGLLDRVMNCLLYTSDAADEL